jgi:acetate kinase
VLVLNSGSSSVKFALLDPGSGQRVLGGQVEKVGTAEAVLHIRRDPGDPVTERLADGSYPAVISRVLGLLPSDGTAVAAAGHRVVHGGERFTASVLVDDEVIAAIRSFSDLAPLHNPANLAGIEAVRAVRPDLPQGRLDALVFTGGVGENSAVVRGLVLARLGFLGLAEDAGANAQHGLATRGRISPEGPVLALVVPTDEELMIARDTARLVAADRP